MEHTDFPRDVSLFHNGHYFGVLNYPSISYKCFLHVRRKLPVSQTIIDITIIVTAL
jgi:hypothetical protein